MNKWENELFYRYDKGSRKKKVFFYGQSPNRGGEG